MFVYFIAIWSLKQVKLHVCRALWAATNVQKQRTIRFNWFSIFCIGIYSFQFCFSFLSFSSMFHSVYLPCCVLCSVYCIRILCIWSVVVLSVLFYGLCVRAYVRVRLECCAWINPCWLKDAQKIFGVLKVRFYLLCILPRHFVIYLNTRACAVCTVQYASENIQSHLFSRYYAQCSTVPCAAILAFFVPNDNTCISFTIHI